MTLKTATFYGLLCFECGVKSHDPSPKHQPDIHLNLWEHGDSILLDIGLMLDVNHPCKSIDVFFPWAQENNNYIDLLDRISGSAAITAIFNESLLITQTSNNSGIIISNPLTKQEEFVVVKSNGAIVSRSHDDNSHAFSIDLATLCERAKHLSSSVEKMYIRFRVKNIPKSFYSVGLNQADKGFTSSWQYTEIIDFRLNVRRGVPADLEASIGKFLDFGKVHLFLMRSREHDLVFQDTLFRACRSLEDEDFWADYSLNGIDEKGDAKSRVKRSFGYQWTKKSIVGSNEFIKEFSILARFKKIEFTIKKFIIYALLLGALGNGLWDGVKWIYGTISPSKQVNFPKS